MSDDTIAAKKSDSRLQIAMQVLRWSTIGLLVIAIIMVLAATAAAWKEGDPDILLEVVERIFTAILPLLATWVGTVLAFYFSKENYQAASESVQKTFRQLTDERLKTIYVRDEMRRYDQITRVELDTGQPNDGEDVNLKSGFLDKLGGKITRIPVFDNNRKGLFIIHESMLYKFVNDITADPLQVAGVTITRANATLKHFLDHASGANRQMAKDTIAFLAEDRTLADAKMEMGRQAQQIRQSCRDVFVTASGARNEPVLGWLTDRKIEQFSRV